MRRFRASILWLLVLLHAAFALPADDQMRFADGVYLRGLHETAVGEYLRLLRDHPDSPHVPAALFRTAECYRQMGNQSGAERFYRRVVEEHPDSPHAARALLRRAEVALAEDRPQLALELVGQAEQVSLPPEVAAAAAYYRGMAHQRAGDLRPAAKAYEAVLARHRESPHAAYAALELAGLHAGDSAKARDVANWFEMAVQNAGTPAAKAEALFRWGDWAYRREDYQVAADVFQSLLVELPEERRARDALLASAWSLYYLDRFQEAIERIEPLTTRDEPAESVAAALFLRAAARRRLGRDREALSDYDAIRRRFPASRVAPRADYERMATFFLAGDYAAALAALPASPDPSQAADVLWMRAESEHHLGRADLARQRYESFIAQFADSPHAPAALIRLGEGAREAGRHAEAAAYFRRVVAEYPDSDAVADALQASALANLRAGDPSASLADWNTLLQREPDADTAAEARLQKALVLVELRRSEEALALLDELIRSPLPPGRAARAHVWRGVLLADSEKWSPAEEAFRAGLAAGPDPHTEALARLRLVVALQRQDRMDEAADQAIPLLGDADRVAENPALIEWVVRRRFEQEAYARTREAATALARHAREAAWRQIGWHWVGVSQSRLGDEAAAKAAWEESVAQPAATREGIESRLALADLELRSGRARQAAEQYSAAAEAAATDETLDLRARAYYGLGEAAASSGDVQQAARHFMSIAVLFDHPEWSPRGLFRAGHVWGEAGRSANQEAAWSELRERYPDSPEARQLEESLL